MSVTVIRSLGVEEERNSASGRHCRSDDVDDVSVVDPVNSNGRRNVTSRQNEGRGAAEARGQLGSRDDKGRPAKETADQVTQPTAGPFATQAAQNGMYDEGDREQVTRETGEYGHRQDADPPQQLDVFSFRVSSANDFMAWPISGRLSSVRRAVAFADESRSFFSDL